MSYFLKYTENVIFFVIVALTLPIWNNETMKRWQWSNDGKKASPSAWTKV